VWNRVFSWSKFRGWHTQDYDATEFCLYSDGA